MNHIHIKQLNFNYDDEIRALEGIDLEVKQGSRMALVGPNGAGKTSLLLALSGLIEVQGEILINDQIMSQENGDHLRRNMSYVFQNPDEMLFMPTVIEDVCFGLDSLGLSPEAALQRGREALSQVALEGFEQRSAHHLSYGERRRVCLATSIARRSELILFDEPTRELDPHGRRNFINLFAGFNSTLILATHDLELVLETCEQMVLMDAGKIVVQGEPHHLLADPLLMSEHRLEVPHSLLSHPHAHSMTGIIINK